MIIKEYCKLKENKELPYLDRAEGGLGGNNNQINKQIRFRHICEGKQFNGGDICYYSLSGGDNDIVFNEITSGEENWTYEELDDIIYAFIKTANDFVGTESCNGFIELRNNKNFF